MKKKERKMFLKKIECRQGPNKITIKIQLLCSMKAAIGFNLEVQALEGLVLVDKNGK